MKHFTQKAAGVLLTAAMIPAGASLNVYAEMTANPLISRDCPAYTSGDAYAASQGNDAFYYTFWSGQAGDYLAYDLSGIPEDQRKTVIAAWYNTTAQYDYTVGPYSSTSNGLPTDYTIEVNAAQGGTYPEDGWVCAETVEDNLFHSRQHVVEMEGYNWLRLNVRQADNSESGRVSINMDVHDVSQGISDSWMFYGDSITAGGMMNCYGTGYAELLHAIDDRYFPIQENGGIGGTVSREGRENIDRWLAAFPGKYVSIAYGTNDAWGNQDGDPQVYYDNTAAMVEAVLAAGKVPVLPKIPYSTEPNVNNYVPDYNAMIDKLYEDYPQIIKGPDFYAFFEANPDLLSGDGVHPADTGYAAMRQLWAETMYTAVYEQNSPEILHGDVNSDGQMNAADVVALQKYLLNLGELADAKAADMTQDGKINIFDLMVLKRSVLKI